MINHAINTVNFFKKKNINISSKSLNFFQKINNIISIYFRNKLLILRMKIKNNHEQNFGNTFPIMQLF